MGIRQALVQILHPHVHTSNLFNLCLHASNQVMLCNIMLGHVNLMYSRWAVTGACHFYILRSRRHFYCVTCHLQHTLCSSIIDVYSTIHTCVCCSVGTDRQTGIGYYNNPVCAIITLCLLSEEIIINPCVDQSCVCSMGSERVRHGDVTAGVKHVWNVITVDKCSFFHS